MSLVRSVIENLKGTEIFGIIGFFIFFTFFIIVVIYVVRMRKNKVDEYSRLPLIGDEDEIPSVQEDETKNK